MVNTRTCKTQLNNSNTFDANKWIGFIFVWRRLSTSPNKSIETNATPFVYVTEQPNIDSAFYSSVLPSDLVTQPNLT